MTKLTKTTNIARTTKIILISVLSILVLLLSSILWVVLHNGSIGPIFAGNLGFAKNGSVESSRGVLVLEQEIAPNDIVSLHVKYDKTPNNVYFYEGEEENIIIREYHAKAQSDTAKYPPSTVTQQGKNLTIQGNRQNFTSFFLFGGYQGEYTEIYLPADFTAEIKIQTSSGDIWAENTFLQSDAFTVSSISGDINIHKVTADKIKASSTSGNLTFAQTSGNVSASTTSGDILLEQTNDTTQISTTSGDIHVLKNDGDLTVNSVSGEIRIGEANGKFSLQTTSGDLTVEKGNGWGEISTISGDAHIFLSGLKGDFSASTTSGNVTLQLPADASFSLKFNSTSGKCKTFFDEQLVFNKNGNHAEGNYGNIGDNAVTVSTVSGDLRITN